MSPTLIIMMAALLISCAACGGGDRAPASRPAEGSLQTRQILALRTELASQKRETADLRRRVAELESKNAVAAKREAEIAHLLELIREEDRDTLAAGKAPVNPDGAVFTLSDGSKYTLHRGRPYGTPAD